MALATKHGSFVANTSTGNQAVTGVGFQPKCVLFTSVSRTAVGDGTGPAGTTDPETIFGAAVSSSQRFCLSRALQHNVAASNTQGRLTASGCIEGCTPGGLSQDFLADLVSMDSDGFTINWSNAPGSAILVEYLALGGSGLSAFIGSDAMRTTTGTESITGVGFQPELMLFASIAFQNALPHALSGAPFSIGAAVSASQRGSIALGDLDNSNPSQSYSFQSENALGTTNAAAAAIDAQFEIVTMDADGFTYDVVDAPNAADMYVYLALGGADAQAVAVVQDTQKTSAGSKVKSGLGFQPEALLVFSRQEATAFETSLSTTSPGRVVIGFSDGTTQGSIWESSEDAVTPTVIGRSHSQTKLIQFRNSSRTVVAEAELDSFNADGYTLDWTTADGTARQFIAVAIGVIAAQALTDGGGIVSEENFGVGTIEFPHLPLTDGGAIPTEEAFGAGLIVSGGVQALAQGGGIASQETFDTGQIGIELHLVDGGGILSQEAFGRGAVIHLTPTPPVGPGEGTIHYLRWLKRQQDIHWDGVEEFF